MQHLEERLKELDEEKEELRRYQQLDKQRKSLEYTIYEKELEDAKKKLAEVMLGLVVKSDNKSILHFIFCLKHQKALYILFLSIIQKDLILSESFMNAIHPIDSSCLED